MRAPLSRARTLLVAAAVVLLVVALGAAVGCASSGGASSSDAGPSTPEFSDAAVYDPLDAVDASLATRASQLFASARCSGGAETVCHAVGAGELRLRLGPGGDVIGVRSAERPDLARVVPGAPEASYLYLKVRGDGGIDGDVMPQDRGYDARVDRLVRDWIVAGAPTP